jgi:hypothetical protein
MPAYIVFFRDRTTDPTELATYSREVPATLQGHPITFLHA